VVKGREGVPPVKSEPFNVNGGPQDMLASIQYSQYILGAFSDDGGHAHSVSNAEEAEKHR